MQDDTACCFSSHYLADAVCCVLCATLGIFHVCAGKNFTEGWVEFADKRIAKRTAVALNGQRMGGKRRSAYYDDLWCIKYLPRFKWDDLTEEIAYQKAVRAYCCHVFIV